MQYNNEKEDCRGVVEERRRTSRQRKVFILGYDAFRVRAHWARRVRIAVGEMWSVAACDWNDGCVEGATNDTDHDRHRESHELSQTRHDLEVTIDNLPAGRFMFHLLPISCSLAFFLDKVIHSLSVACVIGHNVTIHTTAFIVQVSSITACGVCFW